MPRCKEAAAGPSECSWCRVPSPLVELTAQHKRLSVVYQTATQYSDSVTAMWQPDSNAKDSASVGTVLYLTLRTGSHLKGQNITLSRVSVAKLLLWFQTDCLRVTTENASQIQWVRCLSICIGANGASSLTVSKVVKSMVLVWWRVQHGGMACQVAHHPENTNLTHIKCHLSAKQIHFPIYHMTSHLTSKFNAKSDKISLLIHSCFCYLFGQVKSDMRFEVSFSCMSIKLFFNFVRSWQLLAENSRVKYDGVDKVIVNCSCVFLPSGYKASNTEAEGFPSQSDETGPKDVAQIH